MSRSYSQYCLVQSHHLKYWQLCNHYGGKRERLGWSLQVLQAPSFMQWCAFRKSHLQILKHLTDFSFKVIISPWRKSRHSIKESCLKLPQWSWNSSQAPVLSAAPGPRNPTIQTGRPQRRNPPQRGNVFPQKQFPPICIPATNSFPVSDATIQKWPVAFWLGRNCSHSSTTCL